MALAEGFSRLLSDIIGSDINILATCEESLFLFTVCHLAAVHPFLAERGKSTIKARGEMGVRSEALNNPKNHLNMCDGARVSGITGERQQVLPGLCYSFSALSLEWNSVRLAQNFLSHSTSVDLKAPSSEIDSARIANWPSYTAARRSQLWLSLRAQAQGAAAALAVQPPARAWGAELQPGGQHCLKLFLEAADMSENDYDQSSSGRTAGNNLMQVKRKRGVTNKIKLNVVLPHKPALVLFLIQHVNNSRTRVISGLQKNKRYRSCHMSGTKSGQDCGYPTSSLGIFKLIDSGILSYFLIRKPRARLCADGEQSCLAGPREEQSEILRRNLE
ncbi:hypothetical protein E5288_WYG004440 [Bos mutus]|uniref:Uncharacterized protein n=1 Tax=Bos mutus TaxID=72004 RepID=A0A6B0RUE2_9CETA|nr:hypothetical protein [Bos mutus]